MTGTPAARARSMIGSMSTVAPYRWTGMMQRTDGDIAAAIRSAVSRPVNGSGSTSLGLAPARLTASAVAMNVLAGTMTSSPAPTPTAISANASASVPEPTPIACCVSQ